MPASGIPRFWASVFAQDKPTRMPVKLPGPVETAIRERSCSFQPASVKRRSRAGISLSE
jgi:hypothetical protein